MQECLFVVQFGIYQSSSITNSNINITVYLNEVS